MLVVVTGASGSGKTTAYRALYPLLDFPSAESDQLGVPPDADTAWRQRRIETWIRLALAEPERDLVLFGGGAPGEVLAAPSAPELEAIAICLLHCDPVTRRRRLLLAAALATTARTTSRSASGSMRTPEIPATTPRSSGTTAGGACAGSGG